MKINHEKIRIRYECISVFLFLLYAFASGGLIQYIYGKYFIALMTIIFATVLIFLTNSKQFTISNTGILLVATLVFIFINNQNLANNNYLYEVLYICLVIFFLFGQKSNSWMNTCYTLIIVFGVFFAFCTILFYFMPEFYINKVIPLFPSYSSSLIYTFNQGYMAGLTAHYSTNGSFLAVPLGICVVFALINSNVKISKYIIVVTFILIALLMTGKRAHLLFALISLFFMYYNYSCDKPRGRLIRIISTIFVVILVLIIVVQFIPSISNTFNRFNSILEGGDYTVKTRFAQYQLAWEKFLESPLIGKGWDWFKYYFQMTTGDFIDVHNVWLQLLCETGVVGSIFFVMFFIIIYQHGYSALMASRRNKGLLDKKADIYLCSAIYIELFFILYCFTGSPLHDAHFWIFYIFASATTEFYYHRIKNMRKMKY